jgi:CRISPR-associated protein Csd1
VFVQALAAYADTYLSDRLADPAFEEKPVRYGIAIFEDGSFSGLEEWTREERRGKRTFLVPRTRLVPKSPVNRNSAVYPLLGCDAIQYLLGVHTAWTRPEDQDKHACHHERFVSLLREAARDTTDAYLAAAAVFYDRPGEVEKARHWMADLKPRAGNVALVVRPQDPAAEDPGGLITDRPRVREWLRSRFAAASQERMRSGGDGMCLISGRIGPIAPTHDKIKGFAKLGGQASGVSLMSFDKAAFRSYGWNQNANSPVSPDRATAYILALNDLMQQGQHRRGASRDKVVHTRFDCAGTAFVFWTRQPSDDDITSLFREAQPDQVNALLTAPFSGRPAGTLEPNYFYCAAVSGNGGRLLVRYWFRESLEHVKANIAGWFSDQRIADIFSGGSPSVPAKLWEILAAIGTRGKADEVPSDRAVQLMRRALHGLPVGRTILAAALSRLRAERGKQRFSPVRTGLIRMCVNDIDRVETKGGMKMPEALDPDLKHPAYLCGRLLAVYEALQYRAGEVKVTVADRYYGMASTHPQAAFPKLEMLSHAHLRKLRRDNPGAAVNIEREISGIVATVGGVFPPFLSLEDQGRFVIGFHHQKAENARRAAEAKARKASALA